MAVGMPTVAAGAAQIAGLTSDSRQVAPGFLFAALPGSKADGRAFVDAAIERGAAAILLPEGSEIDRAKAQARGVSLLFESAPRRRFAQMAAAFHGRQPETVIAVTGTNGKTSVAHFAAQILKAAGRVSGYIGTLGAWGGAVRIDGSLTTPDPVALHQVLSRMADAGVTHLAMEASSHGLDQFRVDGVRVAVAAFTNLSRDHLDYHGSMEAYFAAKARLFGEVVRADGTAVLNADVPEFAALDRLCAARAIRVISFGAHGRDLRLTDVAPTAAAQTLRVAIAGRTHVIELPLAGRFQASNALCAAGCAMATGVEPAVALAALAGLQGVPGRMQLAGRHASGAPVYVDYAHTPDALDTVLNALRPHTAARLIVVFGCGGDRDRGKRPLMGARACELADLVIVTDDNPRSEDPAAIRSQVLAGCPHATEIGDRAEAISFAVSQLRHGDVLLLAGKGHEAGQIVADRVIPFSDVDAARAALKSGAP
ncbi:MAG: UDP-N-acetylmuramoyl-L-alanyl-D-glutamate--2,6-diaminopimelate ligase [Rhodospirillaceae bacterium]|nr:UDP-N-acetylmuramoyl-L-alanyl-D-glutamate--2,6-diaminopimelate ligase [Rhodospirillaceae bacterium]